MAKNKILAIDDDPNMLDLTRYHLSAQGYEVTTAETGEEALKLAEGKHFDVVLTDMRLPDLDGIELVRRFKEESPETELIMVTGYSSVSKAVEATKAGAFYFVEKPVKFEEILVLVEKALERREYAAEIQQLRGRLKERDSYYNIIGSSKAMQNIYEIIDSVAESDANILIIGESGTGKELVANAIHYKSLRAKKPFVKVNCAALPKELIESELFGHTKGAFTGATMDKLGLIGQSNGGSLLMDEIGEMPLELQPKLLRVLQERVYYRIGSEKAMEVDFRLISATNRSPSAAIREGTLREDLYYRINTIEIQVPPLRERAEDIQHLAEHFLQRYNEKYNRQIQSISQASYEVLFAHNWPGNVRELQNIMERAVLLSKGDVIEASALPLGQPAVAKATNGSPVVAAATIAPVAPAAPSDLSFEQLGKLLVGTVPDPKPGVGSSDIFEELEGVIVKAALERTKGNKQAAANLLGLYRPRLYSIIKKHNLMEADSDGG